MNALLTAPDNAAMHAGINLDCLRLPQTDPQGLCGWCSDSEVYVFRRALTGELAADRAAMCRADPECSHGMNGSKTTTYPWRKWIGSKTGAVVGGVH